MPVLKNSRHEKFCLALASGKSASAAYEEAGYVPNRHNASFLKTNQHIIDRVMELQEKKVDRLVLSRQYVIEAVLENAEKALGRKPVKIGKAGEEREVFVYRGDVANTAIRLAGIELSMFTEKKEVHHTSELSQLSDVELLEVLIKEAEEAQQLLLELDVSRGSV
jgi:phage terminase small subunit